MIRENKQDIFNYNRDKIKKKNTHLMIFHLKLINYFIKGTSPIFMNISYWLVSLKLTMLYFLINNFKGEKEFLNIFVSSF